MTDQSCDDAARPVDDAGEAQLTEAQLKEAQLKEAARRRRAAELLGDLEPRVTRDETAEGWNDEGGTSREEEFLRNVPPHHA